MQKFHRNQKGMTLIELTIVAVLIGVMAAIAVPRWLDYIPELRTKTAVRDAVSKLREARSLAVAQKVPYGVQFDCSEGKYVLFANTCDPGVASFTDADSVISKNKLENNVCMNYTSFSDNCVIFEPSGAASSTGTVLMNSGNYQSMFTIEVLRSTGKVKLHRGYYYADNYDAMRN